MTCRNRSRVTCQSPCGVDHKIVKWDKEVNAELAHGSTGCAALAVAAGKQKLLLGYVILSRMSVSLLLKNAKMIRSKIRCFCRVQHQ